MYKEFTNDELTKFIDLVSSDPLVRQISSVVVQLPKLRPKDWRRIKAAGPLKPGKWRFMWEPQSRDSSYLWAGDNHQMWVRIMDYAKDMVDPPADRHSDNELYFQVAFLAFLVRRMIYAARFTDDEYLEFARPLANAGVSIPTRGSLARPGVTAVPNLLLAHTGDRFVQANDGGSLWAANSVTDYDSGASALVQPLENLSGTPNCEFVEPRPRLKDFPRNHWFLTLILGLLLAFLIVPILLEFTSVSPYFWSLALVAATLALTVWGRASRGRAKINA